MTKIIQIIVVILILVSSNLFGQEVILIRHAEVFLETDGWMGHKTAAKFRSDYDTAPVHQFSSDSVIKTLPSIKTDTVYVSGLPRSIATGYKLFGETTTLVSMNMFNEFELHVVRWPLVFPYKVWTGISRGFWIMGVKNEGTESFKEGKKRARLAVDFIEEKTLFNEQIVIVSHGFLNRTIAKEMKKRGWKEMYNNGTQNLGAIILKK